MKKPHQASAKNSVVGGKSNEPTVEGSKFSHVTEGSIGQDVDQIPLFPNRAAFMDQLENRQEAHVNAIEEMREQSGSVLITDLAVKRKAAMSAIRSISTLAKAGDVDALSALYSLAELAVEELGRQSLEDQKAIAVNQIGWPLMLSHSDAWNQKHLKENLYNLELGKNLQKLVNLEALGVKASHLKELVARLVALTAAWKQEEVDQSVLRLIADDIRKEGLGEGVVHIGETIARRNIRKTKKLTAEKIEGLHRFLVIKNSIEPNVFGPLREAAIQLPVLTADRAVQTKWFEVAMKILEALTGGRYELERYGLRQWWGINIRNEHEAIERQQELRNGIRDRMKKAFHQMLSDHLK